MAKKVSQINQSKKQGLIAALTELCNKTNYDNVKDNVFPVKYQKD